jgi:PKD repeat protein
MLNTVSGSHVYEDDGLFTVTVTVTDDDGGSDSDSFTVTVDNVAPSVNAGADQNVNVGETVSLDPATFTDSGATTPTRPPLIGATGPSDLARSTRLTTQSTAAMSIQRPESTP